MSFEESRLRWLLRSSWVRLVVAVVAVFAAVGAVLAIAGAFAVDDPMVLTTALGVVSCAIYVGYVRVVERRRVAELGRAGAARELGLGFLAGALLCSMTVLILWLLGVCTIRPGDGWMALLPALVAGLGVALFEEILFRAIGFRLLEERLGSGGALVVTAALFGAAHALNGMTWAYCVAVAIEAGVLLAAGFMVTRRLWLPIGMHAAWNSVKMGVFGTSAMGGESRAVFATELHGPDILTGGRLGPDVSVVAVALCLAAAIALLALAWRRSHWRAARD
jgi:uncharacterized protein